MSESASHSFVSTQQSRVPDFYVASTLRRRLEEDLDDERRAIRSLREMLPFLAADDPAARPLVEAILENEQTHVDQLSDLLDGLRR